MANTIKISGSEPVKYRPHDFQLGDYVYAPVSLDDPSRGNQLAYIDQQDKDGVTVHKIDRFFPSSKTCTCGYVNKELTLRDRHWTCPECGTRHHRDELAACNILRQGIAELESGRKTTCRPKTA